MQTIENAKSASDYEAIADYYDQQATEAKAKYQEHEASIVRYENSAKCRTWAWHCDRPAQDFKLAEGEAQALAAEHRKIAAEMKSGQTSAFLVRLPSPGSRVSSASGRQALT